MGRLSDIRCFLLDMDGTFYLGDKLIDGSLEFIDAIQKNGRSFLFLTNNSSRSADYYVQKLARLGLSIPLKRVLTSGQATCRYAKRAMPGKGAYVLGNEYLIRELSEGGVKVDFSAPECVIIGYDTTLDYKKMTDVCDLVRAGLPYIATHPDFNCPTETGFAPDIGAIIAFIEASTGRRPDAIVGKPYEGIVEAALERVNLPARELAMVGDRLYTDVLTGINSGMRSVLVLSGETTRAMADASDIKPDLTYNRLFDMIADL